jgi:hypothetical protein
LKEEETEQQRKEEISLLCRELSTKRGILKERKCNLLQKQRTIAKQANLSMMLYT